MECAQLWGDPEFPVNSHILSGWSRIQALTLWHEKQDYALLIHSETGKYKTDLELLFSGREPGT